jgi:spore coat-associated protein N
MSRTKVLRANPRRALAALATLLIAVGVTAASGANFTASKANAGNIMSAGSIDIDNGAGTALLAMSGMKPDSTTSGEVVVKNTGTLTGAFTLTKVAVSDTGLAQYLNIKVEECVGTADCTSVNPTPIYNNKLDSMSNYALGNWIGGASHRYKFTATLDSATPNTAQGKSANVTFQWDATA